MPPRTYQRAFDAPVHFEDDDSAVFKLGGTLINLLKTSAACFRDPAGHVSEIAS